MRRPQSDEDQLLKLCFQDGAVGKRDGEVGILHGRLPVQARAAEFHLTPKKDGWRVSIRVDRIELCRKPGTGVLQGAAWLKTEVGVVDPDMPVVDSSAEWLH